jgi:hypothetical protein
MTQFRRSSADIGGQQGVTICGAVDRGARLAKAQADARTLASAVQIYAAHMDALPALLTDLTAVATNNQGQKAGPMIATLPVAPAGWGTYSYTPVATAGTFTIVNSGDNTSVTAP